MQSTLLTQSTISLHVSPSRLSFSPSKSKPVSRRNSFNQFSMVDVDYAALDKQRTEKEQEDALSKKKAETEQEEGRSMKVRNAQPNKTPC